MMQLFIEFAYMGNMFVTGDSVQDLLLAADQLILIGAVTSRVPRELPLTVYRHLPRLQREAYRCIIDNYEDDTSCEESQHLSLQGLTEILASDNPNVRSSE